MSWRQDLSIAGLGIDLLVAGLPAEQEQQLTRKYAQFAAPLRHGPDIELACAHTSGIMPDAGPRDPEVIRGPHGIESAKFRNFWLATGPRGPSNAKYIAGMALPLIHPVENLLRLVVSEHLRLRGSALFHSAGLAHDGLGYLFPGISGAGKTTLALRAGAAAALSDELPAAVKMAPDATAPYRLFPTPFFGDMGRGEATHNVPLRAICLLDGKSAIRCRRATPPEAVQRLLATALCYGPDDRAPADLAAICESLAAAVPCVLLTTTIDESFPAVIARIEAALSAQ